MELEFSKLEFHAVKKTQMEIEFNKLEFHAVKKKKKKKLTQMETELAKHDLDTIPVYLLHSFIIPLSSNVVPLSHRPYFSQ